MPLLRRGLRRLPLISVLSLHHIALRAGDLARTVAFYRDLLGLPVVREQAGYSVWLRLGDGAVLMIEQRPEGEPGIPEGSMELLAFAVSPEDREALRASGVAIEGETAATTCFRDPDGRRVAVSTYDLAPWTSVRS